MGQVMMVLLCEMLPVCIWLPFFSSPLPKKTGVLGVIRTAYPSILGVSSLCPLFCPGLEVCATMPGFSEHHLFDTYQKILPLSAGFF